MPFDVDDHLALPRLGGLTLSPDGERLVTAVTRLHADRKQFTTALWELDPNNQRTPRRLTRSAVGEQGAAFLPDGALLFVSSRTDPDRTGEQPVQPPGLWVLPADGGEAEPGCRAAGRGSSSCCVQDSWNGCRPYRSAPGCRGPGRGRRGRDGPEGRGDEETRRRGDERASTGGLSGPVLGSASGSSRSASRHPGHRQPASRTGGRPSDGRSGQTVGSDPARA